MNRFGTIDTFATKNAGKYVKSHSGYIGRIVRYNTKYCSIIVEDKYTKLIFRQDTINGENINNAAWPIYKDGIFWLCCDARGGYNFGIQDVILL